MDPQAHDDNLLYVHMARPAGLTLKLSMGSYFFDAEARATSPNLLFFHHATPVCFHTCQGLVQQGEAVIAKLGFMRPIHPHDSSIGRPVSNDEAPAQTHPPRARARRARHQPGQIGEARRCQVKPGDLAERPERTSSQGKEAKKRAG